MFSARRCSLSGKNYDHRKLWVETLLKRFAACFGIDLLGFAILSNHAYLILRSRPDVVQTWDDTDVARRWLLLCPMRKDGNGQPEDPNEMELNTIRNDRQKLETIRLRLSELRKRAKVQRQDRCSQSIPSPPLVPSGVATGKLTDAAGAEAKLSTDPASVEAATGELKQSHCDSS